MNIKWNLAFIDICDSVIFNYLFLVKKGKGKFVLNVTKNIIIRKWLFLFMNRLLKKSKLNESKNDRYVPFYFSLRKMFICVYQSFCNVLTRTKYRGQAISCLKLLKIGTHLWSQKVSFINFLVILNYFKWKIIPLG